MTEPAGTAGVSPLREAPGGSVATRTSLIRYAFAGVVVLAAGFAAYSYFGGSKKAAPPQTTAAKTRPAVDADEPLVPTPTQADKILVLLGQARQLASDGKFAEADARLDEADKVVKGQPQVAQARREIAEMKTPEGQLSIQLTRARLAVEHGDKEAAEKAFAAIESLKPGAPQVAELRARLERDQSQRTRRDDRVTRHLAAMREAVARQDFATADSEFNAAQRIAVDDPDVQQARRELNRARNSAQKKD